MPKFIRTGDDTFKMVEDDDGPVTWEREDRPELPRTPSPTVGPADELRSKTVEKYGLSDRANQVLHDTRVNIAQNELPESYGGYPGAGGFHNKPDNSLNVNRHLTGGWKPRESNTDDNLWLGRQNYWDYSHPQPRDDRYVLQHEFAHSWMDNQMSPGERWDWARNWKNIPEAVKLVNEYEVRDPRPEWAKQVGYRVANRGMGPGAVEGFATLSTSPNLDEETKRQYYQGMYK